jgi:glutamate-1-semialdehyde 2,1-aminomutase
MATKNRIFIERAEGSRLWDIEGSEYIEFTGAMGPSLIGHRNPEYVQALKDHLDKSSTCLGSGVLFTPDDIEVAEKFVKHIPCADQIKFCLSGTDAVQTAIRLARAYTGRQHFIRFGGHYHGWLDNVLGGNVDPNPSGKPFAFHDPNSDPYTDVSFTFGKASKAVEESFLLPWNDIDTLEAVLKKYGSEVALIHFEALVCNHFCMIPRPGYLEKVRELCTKYGIVMSIDEVITGFRVGLGGAQGHFGVTPDLATFGKAFAGGLPFAAVVGKDAIMEQLRDKKVLGPGTFNGYALGMCASLATLKILERDNGAVYRKMDKVQKKLTDGLEELARKHGHPMRVQGARGVFFTVFGVASDHTLYTDEDLAALDLPKIINFWGGMQEQGILVLVGGRWYMNIAHNDSDVDRALTAADKVMATL